MANNELAVPAVARSVLVRGIGWNGLAQVLPLLTQLALTPFLIRSLGLDGFGVWSLLVVFLGTITALDGGVGASLARFLAVHAAAEDREQSGRLLRGATVVFLALGLVVTGLAFAAGPTVVSWLDLPAQLAEQATQAARWLGLLVLLALLYSAMTALLQAHQRFGALSLASGASSLAFVVSALVLLHPGSSVGVLVWVTVARYVVGIAVGLIVGHRLVALRRPILPTASERREFAAYAGRMQLSSLTSFFNGEIDALVVAALLPVRYVGLFAVAHQVAAAARSLPLYAFPPFLSRLAVAFAQGGVPRARSEFDRLQHHWSAPVLVYGAAATVAAGFAVPIWLGDDFRLAGVLAAVLSLGYCAHVALTGLRTCFVRSIGRPGLETRYSVFSTIVNVALTIPLALWLGVVGVVTATAIALVSASIYFIWLCRPFRLSGGVRGIRPLIAVILAAGITAAGEWLLWQSGWHGPVAVVVAGIPPLVGLLPVLLLRQGGAAQRSSHAAGSAGSSEVGRG